MIGSKQFSIYWTSTEASATEAFAFKMTGLKQGRLAKNPFIAAVAVSYFFVSVSAGIFVACQPITCHLPSRLRNVPVFR
ncbi:MAG: hypothetical protein QOF24_3047 [Verrucomicrobiota bacterium]